MDDAEVALVLLNSAAENAKEVADRMREKGHKVGVVSPNVLRPFPRDEIRAALKNVAPPLSATAVTPTALMAATCRSRFALPCNRTRTTVPWS